MRYSKTVNKKVSAMAKRKKISIVDPNINELLAGCPNRFVAVIAAAKQARKIAYDQNNNEFVGRVASHKPMSIALRQLADGDIKAVDPNQRGK